MLFCFHAVESSLFLIKVWSLALALVSVWFKNIVREKEIYFILTSKDDQMGSMRIPIASSSSTKTSHQSSNWNAWESSPKKSHKYVLHFYVCIVCLLLYFFCISQIIFYIYFILWNFLFGYISSWIVVMIDFYYCNVYVSVKFEGLWFWVYQKPTSKWRRIPHSWSRWKYSAGRWKINSLDGWDHNIVCWVRGDAIFRQVCSLQLRLKHCLAKFCIYNGHTTTRTRIDTIFKPNQL